MSTSSFLYQVRIPMMNQNGELLKRPIIEGKGENGDKVHFIPPYNTNFLLPEADAVLELFKAEDPSLFKDLLNESRKYIHIGETDRVIMIALIFLSYVIHHKDIHYLPIILMVSPPTHGKSHILKFITHNGYRGKWLRTFNLSACQRYNDEFHSVTCLDLWDFAESIKNQGYMDFVLGKIEKGATIPKVNRPGEKRYQQSDEYDPYGLLIIGSNTVVPQKYGALLSRVLPISNIASKNKSEIQKPDKPQEFVGFRNRLTAWKARMMTKALPDGGYIELEERLYDMGQPLLQVINEAYPEGYELVVQYLRNIERQKRMDKSQSSEAIMLGAIKSIVNEHLLKEMRNSGNRPGKFRISQKRLIEDVKRIIPQITSRAAMKICREKFNFQETTKRSVDYLIHIDVIQLDRLMKTYGVEEANPTSDSDPTNRIYPHN